uniref:RING-type domain-containing protein n=1 Tax=Brassica oleracea var. oleracea TaxID=109376 RepID=A0A0D3C8X1_BRAOL
MKVLIGLEMLLIDGQGIVIQGFIPPSSIETYFPHMIAGSIYWLNNFFESKSKTVYRIAEPDVTIAFSWNYVLSVLENSPVPFPEDRFRFYGYEEFEATCDLRRDLYDYVGHMKLVNEQTLSDSLVLDEVKIASSRQILVHVQTHDGPVMKRYIWDKAATDFCEKFKALGKPPTVILVPYLCHLSSSRVFFDMDVQATREYLACYYMGTILLHEAVAWFECTTTIDDVVRGLAWYYISCGGYKTKATKGPTTLMCKKCGKTEIIGAEEYLTKLSVYDNNDHASFVLLDDAGRELTGKKGSELVESYFEANESAGDDHVVPVPQALIDTIGQTCTFVINVSKHNLDGKTQALTVTKVLPLDVPALEGSIEENVDEEPANERDEAADGTVKWSYDGIKLGETKRQPTIPTRPTTLHVFLGFNPSPGGQRTSNPRVPYWGFLSPLKTIWTSDAEIEPATTDPDRELTIKIKRVNTSQTEIDFSIQYSTTANGHLTDVTVDLMEHMFSYHDIYFPVAGEIIEYTSDKFASMIPSLSDYEGTHVRTVLSISDFNPNATNKIDLDVALIDLRDSIREPIPEDVDKVCSICKDKLIGTGVVNSLRCNHKYHHLRIVEWFRHNLSCPTCRDTRY